MRNESVMKWKEMERNGKKRNDFPRNSLIFSEILCFSIKFHGYSIKFHEKAPDASRTGGSEIFINFPT